MTIKSPFFVKQNFVSPKFCEQVIDSLDAYIPDRTADNVATRSTRFNEQMQTALFHDYIQPIVPELEHYYGFKYRGTSHPIAFEWYPEGSCATPKSENSTFMNNKWVKTSDHDFTGVLFLSTHNNEPDFDVGFEVFGGKLEFPTHGFGFLPERGTLVVFPSDPHFVNCIAPIQTGELFAARFHIMAEGAWTYQPSDFPGDYTNWFVDLG